MERLLRSAPRASEEIAREGGFFAPLFAPLEGDGKKLLRSAVRSARRRRKQRSFNSPPPFIAPLKGGGKKRFKNPKKPETHLQVVDRIGLERVHHVRELHPVSHEEHGHVVAHEVPVALARVELDREAARVADRLGRAALVDDGREARDHGRLRPRRAEEVGAGEVRDVMRRLEEALGRGAAGVNDALRDALAVELSIFFWGGGVGGAGGSE